MSDTVNPYQSPETVAAPVKPLVAQGSITETMLIYLKGASPWLRFMGILGFIGSGLTALGSLIFLVMIPLVGRVWEDIPGFEAFGGAFGAFFSGSMMVFGLAGGVLLFFPALFTYRFGERIRSYLRTGMEHELELALKNNKSLWKFNGILCIIYLAFIPLLIVAGIIIAVVAAVS